MPASVSAHYWVSSSPFFKTSLFFTPNATARQVINRVQIFDSDGNESNNLLIEFPMYKSGVLELEDILQGVKLQGGIKHGHVIISPEGEGPSCNHLCRLYTEEGATVLGQLFPINESGSGFFPVTVNDDRSTLVVLVSMAQETVPVTVRLISGKRTPEVTVELPAMGSRVVSLPVEFSDYMKARGQEEVQAYLRIRTRSESFLGVQVLEHSMGLRETGLITAVS